MLRGVRAYLISGGPMPLLTLFIVIAIGVIVGLLMNRVGRNWLGRQVADVTGLGDVTYSLVGIAGSFIGHHLIALLLAPASPVLTYIGAAIGALLVIWLWRGR